MNRKERRKLKKYVNADTPKNLSEKIFQFNQLPTICGACQQPFDKQDKEMVYSWRVVVREEQVKLFCPACIDKTTQAIQQMEKKHGTKQA